MRPEQHGGAAKEVPFSPVPVPRQQCDHPDTQQRQRPRLRHRNLLKRAAWVYIRSSDGCSAQLSGPERKGRVAVVEEERFDERAGRVVL